MRLLRIWLCLACLSIPALAQTNTPEARSMSLEDCIEVALKHNLDVQIKRLSPEISRFTLAGAYGAYDPSLYGAAQYESRRQPGSVDANGRAIPGLELETDSFDTGVQGLAPWGMTYNLGITL